MGQISILTPQNEALIHELCGLPPCPPLFPQPPPVLKLGPPRQTILTSPLNPIWCPPWAQCSDPCKSASSIFKCHAQILPTRTCSERAPLGRWVDHVIIMWLSCDISLPSHDYIMWSFYDCHVTGMHVAIMWLSCDHCATIKWLLCDHHVTIMWLSCDSRCSCQQW